jgi:ubiquitin carboxyl-terminal hydrolase 14
MDSISVTIKHTGGKTHSLTLDPSEAPRVFKEAIYQSTGIPVDQMKVMTKGAVIKEDWGQIKLKDGMSFMVVGAAGELPKPPEKKIVFIEGSVLDHLLHPRFGRTEPSCAFSS